MRSSCDPPPGIKVKAKGRERILNKNSIRIFQEFPPRYHPDDSILARCSKKCDEGISGWVLLIIFFHADNQLWIAGSKGILINIQAVTCYIEWRSKPSLNIMVRLRPSVTVR